MTLRHRTQLTRWAAVTSGAALAITTFTTAASAAPPEPPDDFVDISADVAGIVESTKSSSANVAQTPEALLDLTSSAKVDVVLKYDYDAVASYTGGVAGLAATSPAVTGTALAEAADKGATKKYGQYVAKREKAITADVLDAVPAAQVHESYRMVYGGVAATIPGNAVEKILEVPGVVAVQENTLNELLTDSSIDFIGAPAAYEALGTEANAGAGVVYANLDTGVWPEHPSFDDTGIEPYTGPQIACEFGDNPLTAENDPFECNNKLIGGRHFTDSYDRSYPPGDPLADQYAGTARDTDGHGSHTSTTSAGTIVESAQILGSDLGRVQGVAPGAHIIEYKVCGPDGCTSADTMSAVQQAILDGAEVINYSISGGVDPLTDPTELAFLDAYNAGVFVAASAGNDGPGAGTANHLSPWVTTVAASTQARTFASTVTLTADNGETFTAEGTSLVGGVDESTPVVFAGAAPYGDALCQQPAAAGIFEGKIVLCERGGNARVAKGYNVLQGDAEGMILYNPTLADTASDNHFLPAVHLADNAVKVWFDAHAGVTGTFTDGAQAEGQGNVMAAFSSRGPAGSFLKPDITAPGVQILAAQTPTPFSTDSGAPGQYYQAIAGTSMSSPHIAGVAILLKDLHPEWTPGQIKSAIMTQARQNVVKEDTVTPADPFDMGAGHVDVAASLTPPVTISDTAENMFALTGDPVRTVDINLPSVNAPTLPGTLTTTRVLENVTGKTLRVTPKATAPEGTTISFGKRVYTIQPGRTAAVEITISTESATGKQQFAEIVFDTNRGDARIPVAFVPTQGNVSLEQTCEETELTVGTSTTCTATATNNAFEAQTVTLTAGTTGKSLRGGGSTSAELAGAQLGVPSMVETDTSEFVDLGAAGVSAIPVTDEQFVRLNTPAFTFNGKQFTMLSVNSNGYLIPGNAKSEDGNCCNLPAGASPNLPNNLIAPFWTDLNGEGAPGIRVATASGGAYLVIQWEVFDYGTDHLRKFQTWIQTGAQQEISYAYSETQVASKSGDWLVGAENAAGEGDMQAILPSSDIYIESTDPVPGESVSLTFDVKGTKKGTGTVRTEMTAPTVPGTTVVETDVTVGR